MWYRPGPRAPAPRWNDRPDPAGKDRGEGIGDLVAAARLWASIAGAGAALGTACGRSLPPPGGPPRSGAAAQVAPAPTAKDTTAQGIVRYVGSRESAQLILVAGGSNLALVGELAAELRRLQGAEVLVAGPPLVNPRLVPPRAVNVARYEIVSVSGSRPAMGKVDRWQGRLWLVRVADTLELLGAPADLASRLGAKVFVLGPVDAGRIRVTSYGVLREPPP